MLEALLAFFAKFCVLYQNAYVYYSFDGAFMQDKELQAIRKYTLEINVQQFLISYAFMMYIESTFMN